MMVGARGFEPPTSWSRKKKRASFIPCHCPSCSIGDTHFTRVDTADSCCHQPSSSIILAQGWRGTGEARKAEMASRHIVEVGEVSVPSARLTDARQTLTDKTIRTLPPGDGRPRDYSDTVQRGLRLRVSPSGERTFLLAYRRPKD